ncbi:MAG: PAS domain S-box protein [Verrucomicrobia bacterium]|nr:PAS domain S-box protein [Verrucomicrobiota bacterium]
MGNPANEERRLASTGKPHPTESRGKSPRWNWEPYALAIALVLVAVGLRYLLDDRIGARLGILLLVIPLVLSAQLGGTGPGLVATLLTSALAKFLFVPVRQDFRFESSTDLILWLGLLGAGILVSGVVHLQQRRQPRSSAPVSTTAPLVTPIPGHQPSTERRVRVGFILGIVLLIVVGTISFLSVNQLNAHAKVTREVSQISQLLDQVVLEATEIRTSVGSFVISGLEKDSEQYREAVQRIDKNLENLSKKLSNLPELQSDRASLESAIQQLKEASRTVVNSRTNQGEAAGRKEYTNPDTEGLLPRIRELAKKMKEVQGQTFQKVQRETETSLNVARFVVGFGSILAFAFVSLALYLLGKEFARSQAAEAKLREAKEELEARVQKRTSELARSIGSLYASEGRLAEAQKISHTGSYDWNLRTGQQTWSDELYRIFGYESTRQASIEAFERLIHAEDRPHVQETLKRARAGDVAESMEFRIVRRGREIRHLLANARGIRDENHTVGRIVGTIQDITDRKRAEELIKLQQEHSQSLLRLSQQLERAQTQTDVMRACREEVLRTLGFKFVWFYLFSDDRSSLRLVQSAGPGGQPLNGSPEVHKIEGDPMLEEVATARSLVVIRDARTDPRTNKSWVEKMGSRTILNMPIVLAEKKLGVIGSGTFGDEGVRELTSSECDFFSAVASHVAVVLDRVMTAHERQRAERALRENEERLQLASRVGGVGIFEHNLVTGELYASPLLRQITQVGEGENALSGLMERILPEDSPGLLAFVERNHNPEGDGRAELECRLQLANGEIRRLRIQAQTWFEGEGVHRRPIRTIGTVVDITAERQSQAALQRHAALLDLARDGILVRDESSRVVFWSRGAVGLYGYTIEEAMGKVPHELLQTVFPQPLAEIHSQVSRIGHWEGEVIQTCRDGRKIIVTSQWALQRGQVGAPAAILEINRDITESKRLEETRERLAAIVESSDDAIIGKTLDGIITSWNRGAEVIFGYTAEEAVGRPLQMLIPAERAGEEPEILARIRRGNSIEHFETVRIRKDGVRINTSATISPVRDSHGNIVGASQVSRDITERKQAEAALRASVKENSDLRAALDEHAIVAITDPHGKITFVNEKFCAISKYSYEELVGHDHRLVSAGFHSKEFIRDLWTTISQGRVWQGEIKNKAKDGSFFWVATTIVPFLDEFGKPRQYVAIRADITERKRAEEQLRQAQKMESIGTLAGGIAHDFNNILSAILGNAELARLDTDPNHQAYHSIEEIKKAGQRAKSLVQQILAFGRQQPSEQRVIALGSVIQETVGLMRATIPAGVQITSTISPDAPNVLADSSQVHQVLVNLCTNAWHSMEDRPGRIDISLSSVSFDPVAAQEITGLRPGRYAAIAVTDTGKGMDAATLKRIFEPFFTTKPPGKGTGLGLPVVHGIMQSHEGAIHVASEVGVGSTFTLYFPAVVAPAEPAVVNEKPPAIGQGQRILYLDDEEQLVSLASRMLGRWGYRISGFTHPPDALEAFRRDPNRFDLVVTDFNMPGLSGLQVAADLLKIKPDAIVILCSGHLTDELKQKAREVGIRHVIYKPNTVEELSESIHRLMNEARKPGSPPADHPATT